MKSDKVNNIVLKNVWNVTLTSNVNERKNRINRDSTHTRTH